MSHCKSCSNGSNIPCIDDENKETNCGDYILEDSLQTMYVERTMYVETIMNNLKKRGKKNGDSNIIIYKRFKIDDVEYILIGEYHDNTVEQTTITNFFIS